MAETKGTIAFVAKTGGIKLVGDDAWHNPDKSIKEDVIASAQVLKGKVVALIKNPQGFVTELVMEKELPPEQEKPFESMQVSEERIGKLPYLEMDQRQSLILRQVALKCAVEIGCRRPPTKDRLGMTTQDDLHIAEMFEKWLNRPFGGNV